MIFNVPLEKDVDFARELFSLISEHVSDLAMEHEKLPNRIIFSGGLGQELMSYIEEKEWNFKGFKLESIGGILDALTFKYADPLTQIEDRGSVIFEGGTLNGKQVNGIPSPETMGKIVSTASTPSFRIERMVRPEKKIRLKRI